jgi:PAS domain-containing protein
MITGEPNVSHLPEIVRSGAYDFIAKPVLKDVITRAVARAAEKKRLGDEKRKLEEEVKLHAEELERRVEQRTAELAEAHSFLNLVLDSSTEYAIVAVDMEAHITLFNRGAELLFGYAAAETLGRRPRSCSWTWSVTGGMCCRRHCARRTRPVSSRRSCVCIARTGVNCPLRLP